MTTKRKISLIAAVIIIGGAITFFILTGYFNKATFEVKESKEKFIIGKLFDGKAKDMPEVAVEIQKLAKSGEIKGDICVLHYKQPTKDDPTAKAFFGIEISDTNLVRRKGFSYLHIPKQQVVQGYLKTANAYVPKLYEGLEKYVDENGINTKKELLEIVILTGEMQDEFYLEKPVSIIE